MKLQEKRHKNVICAGPTSSYFDGSSESRKTNALLNLIGHQKDTDKINLYDKDPYEPK